MGSRLKGIVKFVSGCGVAGIIFVVIPLVVLAFLILGAIGGSTPCLVALCAFVGGTVLMLLDGLFFPNRNTSDTGCLTQLGCLGWLIGLFAIFFMIFGAPSGPFYPVPDDFRP